MEISVKGSFCFPCNISININDNTQHETIKLYLIKESSSPAHNSNATLQPQSPANC